MHATKNADASDGLYISGKILFEGEPLSGVTIYADGIEVNTTDSSEDRAGIFVADHLKTGQKITFFKLGYVFSPEFYPVGTSNVYDLKVNATKSQPDEHDDENEDKPPDGDDDEIPPIDHGDDEDADDDDPIEPPVIEKLPAVNMSIINGEQKNELLFAADINSDGFEITVTLYDKTVFKTTVSSELFKSNKNGDESDTMNNVVEIDGIIFTKSDLIDINEKQYAEYSMSTNELLKNEGTYSFSVKIIYGDEFSDARIITYDNNLPLPAPTNLCIENGILSWSLTDPGCEDTQNIKEFKIYLNGIIIPLTAANITTDNSNYNIKTYSCDIFGILNNLSAGKYEIIIETCADNRISSISEVLVYEIT